MNLKKRYSAKVLRWLTKTLVVIEYAYAYIPISELYKVFRKGTQMIPEISKIQLAEFDEMVCTFVEMLNSPGPMRDTYLSRYKPLSIQNDEIVCTGFTDEWMNEFRREKDKYGNKYYIFSYEQVQQLNKQGYLDSEKNKEVLCGLTSRYGLKEEEAIKLIGDAAKRIAMSPFEIVNAAKTMVDSISRIKKKKIEYTNILIYCSKLYSGTPQIELCGHLPDIH